MLFELGIGCGTGIGGMGMALGASDPIAAQVPADPQFTTAVHHADTFGLPSLRIRVREFIRPDARRNTPAAGIRIPAHIPGGLCSRDLLSRDWNPEDSPSIHVHRPPGIARPSPRDALLDPACAQASTIVAWPFTTSKTTAGFRFAVHRRNSGVRSVVVSPPRVGPCSSGSCPVSEGDAIFRRKSVMMRFHSDAVRRFFLSRATSIEGCLSIEEPCSFPRSTRILGLWVDSCQAALTAERANANTVRTSINAVLCRVRWRRHLIAGLGLSHAEGHASHRTRLTLCVALIASPCSTRK